jgi:amidase
MDTYHRWMETVAPWSLTSLPVASIPAGFNSTGLPTGIQLIGRPREDFKVLQLAHAYDEVTQLPLRHPPATDDWPHVHLKS